jgi:hypothetical protein
MNAVEVMLPLINHYADDIRIAVAQSLPLCAKSGVEALKKQGQDPRTFVVPFFAQVLTPLLSAIAEEGDSRAIPTPIRAILTPIRAILTPIRAILTPIRAIPTPICAILTPIRAILTPVRAVLGDMEVLQEQLQALGDLLENGGERCLSTDEQKKQVCSVMITILQEILASREARHAANAADAEDLDDEALEALQVDEHRIAILLNGNYVHTR